MSQVIVVPTHLDALYLEKDKLVAEPAADFSKLPYVDLEFKREVNFDTANISEEIVSQPFQSLNLNLKKGVHLHWAMPDALTLGIQHPGKTEFPVVPNRWFVRRSRDDQIEKQWVVESDYLHPDDGIGNRSRLAAINYYHREGKDNKPLPGRPFRYMGRKLSLDLWLKQEATGEYLPGERLTVIGYGVPTFAAFYPNCHSVFGFHDDEIVSNELKNGLKYEVVGWYSNPEHDPIPAFVRRTADKFIEQFPKNHKGQSPSAQALFADILSAMRQELKWEIGLSDQWLNDLKDSQPEEFTKAEEIFTMEFQRAHEGREPSPQEKLEGVLTTMRLELDSESILPGEWLDELLLAQTLMYASLEFANAEDGSDKNNKVVIAVGNTTSEAMSTYLAHQIKERLGVSGDEALSKLEDQLESLHLSSLLETQELDTGPKFRETRHAEGFAPVSAGDVWTVRLDTPPSPVSNSETESTQAHIQTRDNLPTEVTTSLDDLNRLQRRWDQAQREIDSRRRQLFADWYKYMLSAYHAEDANRGDDYPDVDQVRSFIENMDIRPLRRFIENAEEIRPQLDEAQRVLLMRLKEYDEKQNTITAHQFEKISSARYWQPNEPVILITGKGVTASQRHGQDGRLNKSGLLQCEPLLDIETSVDDLIRQIDRHNEIFDHINLKRLQGEESIAFRTWTQQPWNPIMLEWELEILPSQSDTNSMGGSYAHNVIIENYTLASNAPDLTIKNNRNALGRGSLYSNNCIMIPEAGSQLKGQIEAYLEQHLFEDYYEYRDHQDRKSEQSRKLVDNNPNTNADAVYEYGEKLTLWYTMEDSDGKRLPKYSQPIDRFNNGRLRVEEIERWYLSKPKHPVAGDSQSDDPIYIAILAYEELYEGDQPKQFLSQALGGFNEELLMRKQTMQLPVEDPLGLSDYQEFTAQVAELLGRSLRTAPDPHNEFNPIRTGAINITRLRLIDTFGQVLDFNHEHLLKQGQEILTPQRLTTPGSPNLIWMPPRLVQPAHIDFRFLMTEVNRANGTESERTPICGWLLPNNVDGSLMVYDNAGLPLGSVIRHGELIQWQAAPGRNREVDEIPDPHLKRMVKHILSKVDSNFLEDFLTTLNTALETISPESFAQNQSLALLMGRPIAVVRATLNLELDGEPAVHQGWTAFRQDMIRSARETDDFTRVRFPIRVGEYQQMNDGVVGYWKETRDDYEDGKFYAPQTPNTDININHPDIVLRDAMSDTNNHLNIQQSIDSPPQQLTLLMDPRGVVHITSGILPTKVIRIPSEQYSAAFEEIEVMILTAPLLTAAQTRALPIPLEPGFEWSWLEHKGWIEKQIFIDTFGTDEGESIWQHLLERNWLKVTKQPDRAKINPMGRRGDEKLAEEISDNRSALEDQIERLFWSELWSTPTIEKQAFVDQIVARLSQQLWTQLLSPKVGWLNWLENQNVFGVVPVGKRISTQLNPEFASMMDELNLLFTNNSTFADERFFAEFVKETIKQDGEDLWTYLLQDIGWLKPIEKDLTRVEIVPANKRSIKDGFGADFAGMIPAIEASLIHAQITLTPTSTEAAFTGQQEIREGWLVLNRKASNKDSE